MVTVPILILTTGADKSYRTSEGNLLKIMKKTYFISPLLFFIPFSGILIYSFLRYPVTLTPDWFAREAYFLGILGGFIFLCWGSLIITIDGDEIIRRRLFVLKDKKRIIDILSIKQKKESDIYGTMKFLELRFKDGTNWNILLFGTRNMMDLISRVRAIVPSAVDSSVEEYIERPY